MEVAERKVVWGQEAWGPEVVAGPVVWEQWGLDLAARLVVWGPEAMAGQVALDKEVVEQWGLELWVLEASLGLEG